MMKKRVGVVVAAVCAALSVQAKTWNVSLTNPDEAGFTGVDSLTNALYNAANNDIVQLSPGTYDLSSYPVTSAADLGWSGSGDNRSAYLVNRRTLSIRGNTTKNWRDWTEADMVILKGAAAGQPNRGRIIYGYTDGRGGNYRGLVFENGDSTASPSSTGGGGLYFMGCSYGYATNCIFRSCKGSNGGGTYAVACQDCYFTNCTATSYGGGAYLHGENAYNSPTNYLRKCEFVGCTASRGGGVYANSQQGLAGPNAGYVEGCLFRANHASGDGGGLYEDYAGVVRSCRFEGNDAASGGAAVISHAESSVFTNCTFVGNVSTGNGGAVLRGNYYQCAFADNRADPENSGSAGGAGYQGVYRYCTFTNNASGGSGGGVYGGTLYDCTLIDNATHHYRGGGAWSSTAYRSVFKDNKYMSSGAQGGACGGSTMKCYDCTFTGTGDVSGGVYVRCDFNGVKSNLNANWVATSLFNGGYDCCLTNCLIRNCEVSYLVANYGKRLEVVNCTFANNKVAVRSLQAMRGTEYTSPTKYHATTTLIANCLFSGNTAGSVKADLTSYLENTATAEGVVSTVTFANCLYEIGTPAYYLADSGLESGYLGTDTCFQGKARFAGEKDEDHPFSIRHASDARNRGANATWMETATDRAGNARIAEGTVDLGCYEVQRAPGMMLMVR